MDIKDSRKLIIDWVVEIWYSESLISAMIVYHLKVGITLNQEIEKIKYLLIMIKRMMLKK